MKKISIKGAVEAAPVPSFCAVNDRGRVVHNDCRFFEYLEQNGFRTFRSGGSIELIRTVDNVISIVSPVDIKQFVLDFAKMHLDEQMASFYYERTDMFDIRYLNALKEVTPEIYRDEKQKAFFYYKNGVVEVNKTGISKPVLYSELDRLVWNNHIIQRDFVLTKAESVFEQFCRLITNLDESRFLHLQTIIGYLMHNYRTSANTRAVILNDENVRDEPEGGSGKSLLIKAIGNIRNVVEKDGKKFNPSQDFVYSCIDESTDIFLIDDIRRGFNFEYLFSAITNGFNINRKNKDEYRLPVEKSPLIAITANVIIRGISSSFRRRQYSIDIGNYFSANHTPIDEFDHTFFVDWDSAEWMKFDTFMLSCVQLYLAKGIVVAPESDGLKKNLIRATCDTFADWVEENIEDLIAEDLITTARAKGMYLDQSGINAPISDKKFISWLKVYCELNGLKFGRDRSSKVRGFKISR